MMCNQHIALFISSPLLQVCNHSKRLRELLMELIKAPNTRPNNKLINPYCFNLADAQTALDEAMTGVATPTAGGSLVGGSSPTAASQNKQLAEAVQRRSASSQNKKLSSLEERVRQSVLHIKAASLEQVRHIKAEVDLEGHFEPQKGAGTTHQSGAQKGLLTDAMIEMALSQTETGDGTLDYGDGLVEVFVFLEQDLLRRGQNAFSLGGANSDFWDITSAEHIGGICAAAPMLGPIVVPETEKFSNVRVLVQERFKEVRKFLTEYLSLDPDSSEAVEQLEELQKENPYLTTLSKDVFKSLGKPFPQQSIAFVALAPKKKSRVLRFSQMVGGQDCPTLKSVEDCLHPDLQVDPVLKLLTNKYSKHTSTRKLCLLAVSAPGFDPRDFTWNPLFYSTDLLNLDPTDRAKLKKQLPKFSPPQKIDHLPRSALRLLIIRYFCPVVKTILTIGTLLIPPGFFLQDIWRWVYRRLSDMDEEFKGVGELFSFDRAKKVQDFLLWEEAGPDEIQEVRTKSAKKSSKPPTAERLSDGDVLIVEGLLLQNGSVSGYSLEKYREERKIKRKEGMLGAAQSAAPTSLSPQESYDATKMVNPLDGLSPSDASSDKRSITSKSRGITDPRAAEEREETPAPPAAAANSLLPSQKTTKKKAKKMNLQEFVATTSGGGGAPSSTTGAAGGSATYADMAAIAKAEMFGKCPDGRREDWEMSDDDQDLSATKSSWDADPVLLAKTSSKGAASNPPGRVNLNPSVAQSVGGISLGGKWPIQKRAPESTHFSKQFFSLPIFSPLLV